MSHPLTPEQQTVLTTFFGFAPDRPTIIIGATLPTSEGPQCTSGMFNGGDHSYPVMLAMILNIIDAALIDCAHLAGVTPDEMMRMVADLRQTLATNDQTRRTTIRFRSGDRA